MTLDPEYKPNFSDQDKLYFQKMLSEQSGKSLNLTPELLTNEQKATSAHETGDIDALKDPKVRAAYLSKFGVDAFGRLHLRITRERREKQRQAEQEQLIAQNKARRSRI